MPLRALEAVQAAGMPLPPGGTSRPRKGGVYPCSIQNYTSVFSNIERRVFKQPDAHPSDAPRLFTAQGRAMALIAAQALVDSSPHLHPRPSFVNHVQARPGCVVVEAQCVPWRGRGRGPQLRGGAQPGSRTTASAWLRVLRSSMPELFGRVSSPVSVSMGGGEGQLFQYLPDSDAFTPVEGEQQQQQWRISRARS